MKSRLLMRMTGPVFLISFLLLTLGIVAAWYVHTLQRNVSRVLAEHVASVRAAEELEIGIREVQARLSDYLITRERTHLEAIPNLRRGIDRWLNRAEVLALTLPEQELTERIRQGCDHFFREFESLAAGKRVNPQEVRQLVEDVIETEILPPAHDYLDLNEVAAEQSSRENEAMAERLALALLVVGICGAVAGLLAGYGITRGINQTIFRLSVPVRDAAGRLNEVVGPVTFSSGKGFEELGEALERLAERVGTVVDRLQKSERELLRGEQLAALGQLAAGLAHELRNPLMAMKLLVQTARGPGQPPLDDRDLAVLEEEATRLERTLQSFLDFARPPRLERQTFEVQRMVEQAVCLLSGRAESRGIELTWDQPRVPVVIEADETQFRQVLFNLLLNALDAVPSGGCARIEIEADEGKSPDSWLTVRVVDSGCGLPADLGSRIFEPFVSRKETGTGLGLSICKQIVEAHGGSIEAADRPEGGAVFTARFPMPSAA